MPFLLCVNFSASQSSSIHALVPLPPSPSPPVREIISCCERFRHDQKAVRSRTRLSASSFTKSQVSIVSNKKQPSSRQDSPAALRRIVLPSNRRRADPSDVNHATSGKPLDSFRLPTVEARRPSVRIRPRNTLVGGFGRQWDRLVPCLAAAGSGAELSRTFGGDQSPALVPPQSELEI